MDSIKCRIVNNDGCLMCNVVEKKMVSIGAFIMCRDCFNAEFDVDEIPIPSPLYNKYKEWLKKYKEKYY